MDLSFSKEIATLQKERKYAIETCNFSKLKTIDVHIKTLQEQANSNLLSSKKIQSDLEFKLIKEKVQENIVELKSLADDEISVVRLKFKERFLILHKKHSKELLELSNKHKLSLESESTRIVPESISLVSSAQMKAKYGEYEIAEKIFEDSKRIQEKTIERRIQELNELYHLEENDLLKKHKIELENSQKKMEKQIEAINIKLENEIQKKNKEIQTASIRLGINNSNDFFSDKASIVSKKSTRINNSNSLLSNKSQNSFSKTTPIIRKSPINK